MKTYLLELGSEEIPARFMPKLLSDLASGLESMLRANGLWKDCQVTTQGTYRRLSATIRNLPSKQADQVKRHLGPSVAIALNDQGDFLPPAMGFAKKLGLEPQDLEMIEENGKKVVGATITQKGESLENILPKMVIDVLKAMPLPIVMTWGIGEHRFVRPVHWILSLFDDAVLPLTLFGCEANRFTYGHRFCTPSNDPHFGASGTRFSVAQVSDYEIGLSHHGVIVDSKSRQEMIVHALNELGTNDEDLVEEVVYLTENPSILVGEFDKGFLEIPEAVLITTMKKNQKYFPIYKDQKLSPLFAVVAENVTPENRAIIIAGNQRVLRARLDDAAFFWKEDLTKPPSTQVDALKTVVFQKNVGSLFDKTQRLKSICKVLSDTFTLGAFYDELMKASDLCKTDLVSHMVFEMPTLQGHMGGVYASREGHSPLISEAISEHYHPRFSGDTLPKTDLGFVLSLADKLDTLVCSFWNGFIPTGSQDPWAARRLANGIIAILFDRCLKNYFPFKLAQIIETIYGILGLGDQNKEKLMAFLTQRLKQSFLDKEISYDIVDALEKDLAKDPFQSFGIGIAFQTFRFERPDTAKQVSEAAVRVRRLAPETGPSVNPTLFVEEAEKALWRLIEPLERKLEQRLWSRKYEGIFDLLEPLALPLTTYFDQVLVMAPDETLKQNRLATLSKLKTLFEKLLTFDHLVFGA